MAMTYREKLKELIDYCVSMQLVRVNATDDPWIERPRCVLVLLACGIFITEVSITLVFFQWPVLNNLSVHIFGAVVLTLVVLPGLYLLVLRPQVKLRLQRLLLSNALQTSRENFEAIVARSMDGTLVLDREGMIQYANPAAEQLLQQSSQKLLGSMFGFPASAGQVTEIDVLRRNHQSGTAEMRTMQTDWHGEQAMLVSLRDISDTVRLREQLREQSLSDELTGINNRRSFLLLAEQQIRLVTRTRATLLLIFIDLDRFKKINDSLGHEVGDQALKDMANILSQTFRGSDIIARFGGDEFVVLTIDADGHGLDIVITRLQETITRHNQAAGRPYQLLISFGVASYDVDHPVSLDDLIKRADQRMYQQKRKHSINPALNRVEISGTRRRR